MTRLAKRNPWLLVFGKQTDPEEKLVLLTLAWGEHKGSPWLSERDVADSLGWRSAEAAGVILRRLHRAGPVERLYTPNGPTLYRLGERADA